MSYTAMCNFCGFSSQSYAECKVHAHRCVGTEMLAKRSRKYCNYCSLFSVSKAQAYKEGDYKVEEDCYHCGTNSSNGDEGSAYTYGDESNGDIREGNKSTLSSQNNNDDVDENNNNNNNNNSSSSSSSNNSNNNNDDTVVYNNKSFTRSEYNELLKAVRSGTFVTEEASKQKGKEYVYRTSGKYGIGYYCVDIPESNNTKEVILFEFHGNTIKPPKNGDLFQPLEVVELITSLTVKGTSERGELIKLLLQKKLVKGKTTLYDTLKKYEEGKEFKLTWNERGAPKKNKQTTTTRYTDAINANPKRKPANIVHKVPSQSINKTIREQIRYDIGEDICSAGKHIDKKGWRGELYLEVTPVHFSELNQYDTMYSNTSGILHESVDLTKPTTLDICKFLGQRDRVYKEDKDKWVTVSEPERTVCRLYFNQKEFPPPPSHLLHEGGCNETFAKLKNYIMVSSTSSRNPRLTRYWDKSNRYRIGISNSAVVCNGGSKKYQNKVFRCAHAYKNVQGTKQSCPMSFTVCWDRYGYYINLMTKLKKRRRDWNSFKILPGTNTTGCPWHCCGSHELLYRCNICNEVQLYSESLLEHKKTCKPKGSYMFNV